MQRGSIEGRRGRSASLLRAVSGVLKQEGYHSKERGRDELLTDGSETRTALALNTSKNWAEQNTPSKTSLRIGDNNSYVASAFGTGSVIPSPTSMDTDDISLGGEKSQFRVGVRLTWGEDIVMVID